MSTTYSATSGTAFPALPFTITVKQDGDLVTAASDTTAEQKLGDYSQFLNELVVGMQLTNLADLGAVNSQTAIADIYWSSRLKLWVVVGAGGLISTSPDGITWTAQTSGTTNDWKSIAESGTVLCACGRGNGGTAPIIATSPDGVTWTLRTSNGVNNDVLTQIAYDTTIGSFVAVGQTGYVCTATSTGVTWTKTVITGATTLQGVATTNAGIFVMTGVDGSGHVVWTCTTAPATAGNWHAQAVAGLSGYCVGVSYSPALSAFLMTEVTTGNAVLSTDATATAWNSVIACPSLPIPTSMKWVGRAFLCITGVSATAISYAPVGRAWRTHTPPLMAATAIANTCCGYNSDTNQVLIGATTNVWSTLLLPTL